MTSYTAECLPAYRQLQQQPSNLSGLPLLAVSIQMEKREHLFLQGPDWIVLSRVAPVHGPWRERAKAVTEERLSQIK